MLGVGRPRGPRARRRRGGRRRRALEKPGARDANLAGARCKGGAPCTCRNRIGDGRGGAAARRAAQALRDPARRASGAARRSIRRRWDTSPPARDEVVLLHRRAAGNDVGRRVHGDRGAEGRRASRRCSTIAEYGPKGPWWYDVSASAAPGPGGKCNRDAADAWSAEAKGRKRGRVDPCGSSVISRLVWDTSGGIGNRELGIFKDFTVKFTMEVKRFPTQWPPHAKECVAK